MDVLSTRAEYVTGGDVLIGLPGAVPEQDDAITAVARQGDGETELTVTGDRDDGAVLVEGLPEGESELLVTVGGREAAVTVTDNPVIGPLFSGPHLPLAVCTTESFGLGPAVDDDCTAAEAITSWRYATTDRELVPLEDPSDPPDDVTTVAIDGEEVPFIVRDEVGTINRAVYFISVLDPDPGSDEWDDRAWNGDLVYRFGGGCGTSYSQGSTLLGDADPDLYARGYATATATFDTLQTLCNPTISAETALMVKEHFSERYGVPGHTIGEGGSGGAIQQYLIAQNYPGILDAIAPILAFPDILTTSAGVTDCGLLLRFGRSPTAADWSADERLAVAGHASPGTCIAWEQTFLTGIDASDGCATDLGAVAGGTAVDTIDQSELYDARGNPDGLRCSVQDSNINQLGTEAETGFARRPLDNVGVTYGLAALVAGAITTDQFLDLNESIGGYDIDGVWIPERTEIDEATAEVAYATGGVLRGKGAIADIPVITVDVYTDDQGDIHDRVRAFAIDDRLAEGPTGGENHLVWTVDLPEGDDLISSLSGQVSLGVDLTAALDDWLDAVDEAAAADPGADRATLVADARPADLDDRCVLPGGEELTGPDVHTDGGPCNEAYPVASGPRIVAGADRSEVVVKCSRRPVIDLIDTDLAAVDLSAAQQQRLEQIFPEGVCDHDRPGVGTVDTAGTWLSYNTDPAIRPAP
jgi:hypothetical protein